MLEGIERNVTHVVLGVAKQDRRGEARRGWGWGWGWPMTECCDATRVLSIRHLGLQVLHMRECGDLREALYHGCGNGVACDK